MPANMIPTSLEDILALDALCLREADGGDLDIASHRSRLETALARSRVSEVRRAGVLVACCYIWPLKDSAWFVGGLSIHPEHRNAAVSAELFRSVASLINACGATELHSHVLVHNWPSLRLHRKLGFVETRRSDVAIAFVARTMDIDNRLFLRSRVRNPGQQHAD